MRGIMFILIILLFCSITGGAQLAEKLSIDAGSEIKNPAKKSFYISLGWHRIHFTNSTIHFKDNETGNYDFKLIKAKAIDDRDLKIGQGIEEPQWSARVGYFFNPSKGLGIEFCYDHAKYILKQGQQVRLQGTINGEYYDQDTTISENFIRYEHTDGANYWMLSFLKRMNLLKNENKRRFEMLMKAGAGIVRPRTNSIIMGNHRDNKYHIGGYVLGMETSLRYEPLKNIFAEFSLKGAYANYSDVLLYGEGRANQHWFSLQFLYTLAYQFNVGKKK